MSSDIEGGFPIYILDDESIVFIKEDIDHTSFWQNKVAILVAKKFSLPLIDILNLPYCQKRARVVGNKLYCGEKLSKKLIKKIENKLGFKLNYCYDEHETRCDISVGQFKSLFLTRSKN